jgi:hypothetical protein
MEAATGRPASAGARLRWARQGARVHPSSVADSPRSAKRFVLTARSIPGCESSRRWSLPRSTVRTSSQPLTSRWTRKAGLAQETISALPVPAVDDSGAPTRE